MNRSARNACTAGRRRQQGMGLIEVLVAVLIMAFGMLGLAGLHMSALKNNQSSLERAMAVVQTHSIIDAMRADRTNAMNGGFDIEIDAETPTGATFSAVALAAWRDNLVALLGPDATGSVDCNGTLCRIVVRWNDERGTGGSAEQSIETQVQL